MSVVDSRMRNTIAVENEEWTLRSLVSVQFVPIPKGLFLANLTISLPSSGCSAVAANACFQAVAKLTSTAAAKAIDVDHGGRSETMREPAALDRSAADIGAVRKSADNARHRQRAVTCRASASAPGRSCHRSRAP